MNLENVRKLAEFDTPTVANGLELLGVRDPTVGYTGPDIRALMPEMGARVGIAVTGRMDTTTAGKDDASHPEVFYEWLRHIERVAAGRANGSGPVPVFAVIESVGTKPRYTVSIGDGMGTQLMMAGAVGYLTNGCIRDLAGVRAVPLPCWAAGVSPMHGTIRWLDVNVPVVIDGMTVRPGDVVHADENGALVIPPDVADQVYEKALAVREKEAALFATLRQPGMTITRYLESIGR
jgi:4-hydroxy-4-methyl-2-oxoglutarate aldolase